MKKSEIKVGMRVEVIGNEDGNKGIIGKIGVVKFLADTYEVPPYHCAVKFPHRLVCLWDCQGLFPQHSGFFFHARNLSPAPALKKGA